MVTASDGNCNYKVTFKYRTKKCVYYINVETGGIVGNSECETALVEKGEAQCIVMKSMEITKHEQWQGQIETKSIYKSLLFIINNTLVSK